MEKKKINTTKLTEKYIEERPFLKESLKKGLINYSALARTIANDLKISNKSSFDAVLVASRRYVDKIKTDRNLEERIMHILKNGKIEIKNKIGVMVVSQHVPFSQIIKLAEELMQKEETFHLMQGSKTFTLIMPQDFLEKTEKMFRNEIISTHKNLVQIILKTSPEIENIPGVVGYLYSLFAQNGINIFEEMSSWQDTLVMIEEKDLPKAMEILKF